MLASKTIPLTQAHEKEVMVLFGKRSKGVPLDVHFSDGADPDDYQMEISVVRLGNELHGSVEVVPLASQGTFGCDEEKEKQIKDKEGRAVGVSAILDSEDPSCIALPCDMGWSATLLLQFLLYQSKMYGDDEGTGRRVGISAALVITPQETDDDDGGFGGWMQRGPQALELLEFNDSRSVLAFLKVFLKGKGVWVVC